jgi:hypothetical protein
MTDELRVRYYRGQFSDPEVSVLFGQNFRFVLGLFCPVERGVLALSTMSRPVSLSVSTRIHIVRIRVGFTLVKRWVH